MRVTTAQSNRYRLYSGDVTLPPQTDPDVALVLDFLNTVDVEDGTDLLRSRKQWQDWATERDLSAGSTADARQVRETMRAAAGDPEARPGTGRAGASVRVEWTSGAPALVADSAVGAVLAASARLGVLGRWERIKICPADECRWAFYDHSRNHSRTWCSMQVCGNREKARAWRRRTTDARRS